ncbi:MAG: hypothetical protein E7Z65_06355 [Thermoplasmata archaeon]|nr:hypothetical protein [Thermoplasmata archaeon]
MAIDKKVRAEILKKLYAGVPVNKILEEYDVGKTTLFKWKKRVDEDLRERQKEKRESEPKSEPVHNKGNESGKSEPVAFPPIAHIDLDNLADHALLGLWDGLTRIKEGLEHVRYLEGDATRESLTVSYLKEYRQYIALAGRWGGLEDKVDSDNPILTAFTEALKKNRREDNE